jgi:hypothetical protein
MVLRPGGSVTPMFLNQAREAGAWYTPGLSIPDEKLPRQGQLTREC